MSRVEPQAYFVEGAGLEPELILERIREIVRDNPLLEERGRVASAAAAPLEPVDYIRLDEAWQRWRLLQAPYYEEAGPKGWIKRWINRIHAALNRPQAEENAQSRDTVEALVGAVQVLDTNNRRLLARVKELEDRVAELEP